jgi:hypothetical protein
MDILDRTQRCRRFVSGKGGEGDSAQRLLGQLLLGSTHLSAMG